ncbi:MAG: hypothetical protein M3Y85_11725, partial [Bacteroidota bacterium]|nr:hypothetical protein [Bacteroidota bacterium]
MQDAKFNGFEERGHHLKTVVFQNVILPTYAKVVINDMVQEKFSHANQQSVLNPIRCKNSIKSVTNFRGNFLCFSHFNKFIRCMKSLVLFLMLTPFIVFGQNIALSDKALNIFTLGDSNGSFPYCWPEQLKLAMPNAQVFNIS